MPPQTPKPSIESPEHADGMPFPLGTFLQRMGEHIEGYRAERIPHIEDGEANCPRLHEEVEDAVGNNLGCRQGLVAGKGPAS